MELGIRSEACACPCVESSPIKNWFDEERVKYDEARGVHEKCLAQQRAEAAIEERKSALRSPSGFVAHHLLSKTVRKRRQYNSEGEDGFSSETEEEESLAESIQKAEKRLKHAEACLREAKKTADKLLGRERAEEAGVSLSDVLCFSAARESDLDFSGRDV